MARRRRLTDAAPRPPAETGAPETKSALPGGPADLPRARAPIAADVEMAVTRAALVEVTRSMEEARASGRLLLEVPLDEVVDDHLTRDRLASGIAGDDAEMAALVSSLRARGQQTPIEVVMLRDGRYGLISGWRRLTALRQLRAETGEERFATVLAVEREPATAAEAYVAMVEENEIRVGLSYYERARIAAKAVERGVYPTTKAALLDLFANSSRPRRSKIRAFLAIVEALDGALTFPHALPERLGLALSQRLRETPGFGPQLRAALDAERPATAEAELALIRRLLAARNAGSERTSGDRAAPGAAAEVALSEVDGGLLLSGPGVTPAFRIALHEWLATRVPG